MNMNYKICFVCTGNACRSPFAECVTKKLLADAGIGDIELFSLGTLDWGENPRDVAMVDVAKELGYDLSGTTTVMTREKLMTADASLCLTSVTMMPSHEYWTIAIGTESSCSIRWHWMKMVMWKTLIIRLQLYIVVWLNTLKKVVNDW